MTEPPVLSPVDLLTTTYSLNDRSRMKYHAVVDGRVACGVPIQHAAGWSENSVRAVVFTRRDFSCNTCVRIVKASIARGRRVEASKPAHNDNLCTCTDYANVFWWRCRAQGCDTRPAIEPCLVTGSAFRYEKLLERRPKRAPARVGKPGAGKQSEGRN